MGTSDSAMEVSKQKLASIFKNDVVAGTEDIGVDDLNTPQLKLVQSNKRPELSDGKKAEDGWFFRTDTKQQMQTVEVTMLVVRKVYTLNYKKTDTERQHIYFGTYSGVVEPFRMFCRGWSLNGSREFLTEVKQIQRTQSLPMYALKVKLSSVPRVGTTKDGAEYSVYSTVLSILKNEKGEALFETDAERVETLRRFVDRFSAMDVKNVAEEAEEAHPAQAALPAQTTPTTIKVDPKTGQAINSEDIPF